MLPNGTTWEDNHRLGNYSKCIPTCYGNIPIAVSCNLEFLYPLISEIPNGYINVRRERNAIGKTNPAVAIGNRTIPYVCRLCF
jgi:hypothetical protein